MGILNLFKKSNDKHDKDKNIVVETNEKNQNDIIKKIIKECIDILEKKLPNQSLDEYEENGKLYYMNDQNGTIFDWNVNNKISDFMIFYKDGSCGALKLRINSNGKAVIFLYKYKSNKPFYETKLEFKGEEVYNLVITMNKVADNKKLFGKAVNDMNTNIVITEKDKKSFEEERNYMYIKNNGSKIFNNSDIISYGNGCIVSRKIFEDGYKVGYMKREVPTGDFPDSGWQFFAGDETNEYNSDANNMKVCTLESIIKLDPDVKQYLNSPNLSAYIRIDEHKFILDDGKTDIYIKRQ